jgi:signal transduction histidine kinase/PAS domain-containing protein
MIWGRTFTRGLVQEHQGVKLMGEQGKTEAELVRELEELRGRLAELEAAEEGRAEAEGRLRLERQQLISIFDSMDEPVYVSDPQTYEVIYANQALRSRFGDVVGRTCYEVLQDLDSPCPFCTNELIFVEPSGKTHIWEWQNRVDKRWYRCIDRPIRWPDGRMMRYEMAIDITDHKRADEESRRLNRALKMVSECNQALVRARSEEELLPDICRIIVEDGGYRLAWVGYAEQDEAKTVRPVAQMGYDEGYVERLDITWDDTELGRGPTGTAIRSGEPSVITNILGDPAFAPWREDAARRGYQSSIALPLVSEGKTLGALNIYASEPDAFDADELKILLELARDLGYGIQALRNRVERERAEAALKEHSERLEEMVEERTQELRLAQDELVRAEKLAVLGQLAGSVGHELRNPLGVISNAIYYLQATLANADETTSDYLDIIAQQVKNASKTVSNLLDFAQTREPDRGRHSVSDLASEALEAQPPPLDVQARLEIPQGLPPVLVDPQQIGQALENLITNAYQAMPTGGKLTIGARSGRREVSVWVADTGVGISPENMDKVFEPLFTTRVRRTGLGLAASKMFVEANDGSILVESKEGEGSRFTVSLPRADV